MAIYMLAEELTPSQQHSVIFWCVVIILATLAGFGLIAYIRRYMLTRAREAKYDTGFSLSDLRAMRDRGEITPEEYEQTRARVIAKVKGRARQEEREKMEAPGSEDPGPELDSEDAGESPESGETDVPR
jgi:hypothetical protein